MTTTPTIVNLNTVVTEAPAPSQLQQSGALISLGGTTLSTGSDQYCGQLSDLEAILDTGSGNATELLHMGTTFFAQGQTVGVYVLELGTADDIDDEIALLGTWITDNPGVFYSYLVPADWDDSKDNVGSVIVSNGGSGYTAAPTVTFSAPGAGTTATGTAVIQGGAVTKVNVTNPGSGYSAAPTVSFSGGSGTGAAATANLVSALDELVAQYSNPEGRTYFFVTTDSANASIYATQKSVFAVAPSPTAGSTEFQAAMPFYQWLVNNPGPANPLAPMSYRFGFGVTPWVRKGNSSSINSLLTAYCNLILTGAEGGISTACLFKGTLMDGSQASWWYGIDWFQIHVKQALAAAIINGSNENPPLLYDQAGINSLLAVAQNVANSAVTFGCALSIAVSAVPFATYTQENPDDYQAGVYNGFSAIAVGQNGFLTIKFNIDAVQFA
ncbi:hypothetical protein AWB78_01338 [Caballeronia calidae]|uniref:Uncharacterized protein n=1 Tax=Caballeronia calidae TaxID=1777139 RepID=A0A158A6V3_9BURK|nr:hypothetical protein [Caballeronia calidae]SAK53562.1 hypothetical protein AWB78_01338 [Caballeronia calidae]